MNRFLILWAIIIATLNMQNVSAYNDFEKVDISWYFIPSELDWWYPSYGENRTSIWDIKKYAKIYDWTYTFYNSKTLWIITENKPNTTLDFNGFYSNKYDYWRTIDSIKKTNSWEYLLLISKDFIKNIEHNDLYKKWIITQKDVNNVDSPRTFVSFFKDYLCVKRFPNNKVKIKWTFIHPKWKVSIDISKFTIVDPGENPIREEDLDLHVIIVDDITLSEEKIKEEIEKEKFQKWVKQVDNIILWLQKQLDLWKLKFEDLEKKVEILIPKINKLIAKTKDETKKEIYNYLIDQLDDLIFKNHELVKIITN